jgi:beta-lactamase regulating signal transducer with metallopeptidase domain/DNA gyrase inhibitor GyrI
MIAAINQIAQPWWGWMGAMLWQVSLLILIVTALDFVLRRWAYPQVRYALWLLVLIKLVIPPTWTLPSSLVSKWQPRVQARIEESFGIDLRASTAGEKLRIPPSIPASKIALLPTEEPIKQSSQAQPAKSSSLRPGPALRWKAIAMFAWILGMGLFVALLVHRVSRLRRWHKRQIKKKAIPVWYYELLVETTKRLKLGRLPAIVFSKDAKAPAVYGMFRPVLLLPASYLDSLSREDAEHVLLHELAHLKRGDLWLHGLCLLLQIVYWFNPLLIWARRQMKHVREICCDLTIANVLKEKTMKYRETLLNTARELLTETAEPGMGLLGVFEDPFRLVARLRWLEKKTWRTRKFMMAAVVLVTVVMTAAVLPMGMARQEGVSLSSQDQAAFERAEAERIKNLRLDVQIKTIPPLYAAVLPRIGQLDEIDQAFARVKKLLDEAGIKPTGFPFGRYISNGEDVPKEEFVWEIGYPVAPGTAVPPSLQIIQMSEQQVACATVEGIKFTDEVWLKFAQAVKDCGFIPAGPPGLEIWQGESVGKEFWWKTEMQVQAFSLDEGYPGMDISFKQTQPFTAIVLPMQGTYSQLSDGANLLKQYIAEKGIQTTGPPFGRYFTDSSKVPPSRYIWELGYPVEEGTPVDLPFKIRRIDGTKVAFTTLPGPPEPDYPWASFIIQVIIKGHIPALPAMEIWHGDPKKTGAEGPRMELQIPVVSIDGLAETGEDIGDIIKEALTEPKKKR